jgi:hypothetical protein
MLEDLLERLDLVGDRVAHGDAKAVGDFRGLLSRLLTKCAFGRNRHSVDGAKS